MERRTERRSASDVEAKCQLPASLLRANIVNLSTTGCHARADNPGIATKGATIIIDLPDDIAVAGEVIWQKGNSFGVNFHRPISPQQVAQVCYQDILVSVW